MPYAFNLSPREGTSFPKSLVGSLPWDRAPTLHPKPAAGSGELTPSPKVFPILLRSVFPLLPPPLPYISWTLRAALPSRLCGRRRMGKAAALPRSGASELRISSRLELQPIRTTTKGKKKIYNSLCKTQNCLKGVWVWWGVPGAGAWRWVGEAVAGLSRRTG